MIRSLSRPIEVVSRGPWLGPRGAVRGAELQAGGGMSNIKVGGRVQARSTVARGVVCAEYKGLIIVEHEDGSVRGR